MFKKRPRKTRRTTTDSARPEAPSKREPEYWRERLFKNTFTYKGRRVEVNGWSVKIQLFGKRKTFSLSSSDSAQAAAEACRIYQAILARGWEAAADHRAQAVSKADDPRGPISPSSLESAVEHWSRRLIHRKHLEQSNTLSDREFSARIEHARTGFYFPLGTTDEREAAARARRIHQTIVRRGWESANRRFPRELTLALRWLDDPVAWTYITLHTQTRETDGTNSSGPNQCQPVKSVPALNVAVVEPDTGIRRALAACINSQERFRCSGVFATVAEAIGETPREALDFFVANGTLPHQPGTAGLEEFQRRKPGLASVLYSVFEDSDHLFKATPGGAVGYMLKRTATSRIFEPIAQASRPLTREQIASQVRDYFQRLSASLPAGPPSRELASLTPREHEVLALLSKGWLAKEIADSLGISVWTVHGHVKSIFEKLKVHSRTEAVVKFLQK